MFNLVASTLRGQITPASAVDTGTGVTIDRPLTPDADAPARLTAA
ncbi:hypothetical protein [Methylobacterium crusticola]|nr:hypothetical protein [Methylobacterium crusticola]